MVIALLALSVSLQITLMAQNSDLCSALTVSVEIAASTYQEVKFNGLPQFEEQLQAIGIGDVDRQEILRHLKSPVRLLSELVVDPEELLYAMQDCQVVLSGSRGGGYFLPACVPQNQIGTSTFTRIILAGSDSPCISRRSASNGRSTRGDM